MDAVFLNPITGRVEAMPIDMIGAYLPYAGDLDLSKAAEIACIRDHEAALELLASIDDTKTAENPWRAMMEPIQGLDEIAVKPNQA